MSQDLLKATSHRLTRMRLSLLRGSGRPRLPDWTTTHTSDPLHPNRPWSFKHHEYQIGILACTAPYMCVKKSSQVGLSELAVRLTLGLASIYNGTNIIYVLPTLMFARKFMSTRFVPVIDSSPTLKSLLAKDPDSTEVKRLGNSFIHMAGAQNKRSAISIPCKAVIRDEQDFGNQEVLGSFKSRLTHNAPGDEILVDFSTPTISDYGISKAYETGDKQRYMLYHRRCSTWVVLDPLKDLVVPGLTVPLEELTKDELALPTTKVSETWVRCPHCRHKIDQDNLVDPTHRAWVAEHPHLSKDYASFYVSPLDAAFFNTPAKIIKAREDYETTADWQNFALGQSAENADEMILPTALENARTGELVRPGSAKIYGTAVGTDVGKISNLVVLGRQGDKTHLLWAERIRQDADNNLLTTCKARIREFGAYRSVIDAMPDLSVPVALRAQCAHLQSWACYLTKRNSRDLEMVKVDEKEQVLKVWRTEMIDDLVHEINAGRFILPKGLDEVDLVIQHLLALKRVKRQNEDGTTTMTWVSTGQDHYAFSILFAWVALKLMDDRLKVIPLPTSMGMKVIKQGANLEKRAAFRR